MRPYLIQFGDVGVPSFFFMIMVAGLAATFFAAHVAKKENADPVAMLDFGIIAIIASVIGSRIFHVVVENPSYYWESPVRVFYFWQGGFVSIGAFLASALGWAIYMRARHLPPWRYMDIAVTCVPVIIFFVRTGCLLVGCCYGKPTDFFIHLTFNNPASTAGHFHLGEPLHATQLYFMLNAVVMWVVILLTYRYRTFYGQVLAVFMIYYGVTRFLIEFLRGDEDRGMWLGGSLSTGQITMILTFIGGVALWLALRKRNRIGVGK
ncbi:MAG TPA: prolipoprotein diacylglyceryl transferase [bacterium]|nr:prolipoprotein diacylglyceryl transferase [bacterium]